MQAFFARNPDDALRWICRWASHETILRVIEELYEELEREADQERASDQAAISVQVEAAADGGEPEPRGVKRKRALKEKTTRALNKALVDKINLNLAQAVANLQDWENAKAPAGLSNKEQRYRRFATGLSDVLRDWQAIFAVWKRQNHYGKKLFQTVAVEDALRNMVDEVGLTAFKTENFAYKYFDAQKTYVNRIADDMQHRWKMDGLYKEFERLAKEAKDYLFTLTYKKYLGRAATKRTDLELWRAFGDYLDWGKRTQDPDSEQRFEEEESDEGQPNAVPQGDLASIADSLSSTLVGNSLASTPAFQSLA
ncbi:hypothetical protein K504DRAFT_466321 [Pleomassaria siparia CBS 279.74]|uniref:Uncharacterized protein n=1 Tax=Pleomassaria siparia CBS 279.74 TaxID=1314801 RepID=A0A6G1KAF2_9PLEO|nr:hypothetical protein K504DRAFT_466321 [Pleomassaria siparia CBS 279.74]